MKGKEQDLIPFKGVQGSGGILISWLQEAFKLHNSFAMG